MKPTKLKVFVLPYEFINDDELLNSQKYIEQTKKHGRILDISRFQYEINNDIFNQDDEHVMFFYVEYDEQGNESKFDEVIDETVYVFDTEHRKPFLYADYLRDNGYVVSKQGGLWSVNGMYYNHEQFMKLAERKLKL